MTVRRACRVPLHRNRTNTLKQTQYLKGFQTPTPNITNNTKGRLRACAAWTDARATWTDLFFFYPFPVGEALQVYWQRINILSNDIGQTK